MIKWKTEVQVYRSVMGKCRYLLPMYNKLVGTNKIRLQKKRLQSYNNFDYFICCFYNFLSF